MASVSTPLSLVSKHMAYDRRAPHAYEGHGGIRGRGTGSGDSVVRLPERGIGSTSCTSRPRPEHSEELVADQGITTDRDKLNGVGRLTLTRPSRKSIMPGMDKIR